MSWPYGTAQWRRLRAAKLAETPWCEPCRRAGLNTRANTVDHVRSIASGGPAFPLLSGLESMCSGCHGRKTSHLDRPDRRAGSGLMRGCDADGLPLDPNHEWRRENPSGGIGVQRDGPDFSPRTDGPQTGDLHEEN